MKPRSQVDGRATAGEVNEMLIGGGEWGEVASEPQRFGYVQKNAKGPKIQGLSEGSRPLIGPEDRLTTRKRGHVFRHSTNPCEQNHDYWLNAMALTIYGVR